MKYLGISILVFNLFLVIPASSMELEREAEGYIKKRTLEKGFSLEGVFKDSKTKINIKNEIGKCSLEYDNAKKKHKEETKKLENTIIEYFSFIEKRSSNTGINSENLKLQQSLKEYNEFIKKRSLVNLSISQILPQQNYPLTNVEQSVSTFKPKLKKEEYEKLKGSLKNLYELHTKGVCNLIDIARQKENPHVLTCMALYLLENKNIAGVEWLFHAVKQGDEEAKVNLAYLRLIAQPQNRREQFRSLSTLAKYKCNTEVERLAHLIPMESRETTPKTPSQPTAQKSWLDSILKVGGGAVVGGVLYAIFGPPSK